MTAKEYLQQYEKAELMIEQKRAQCKELKEKAPNTGGFDTDMERVQSSPSEPDKIGLKVSEYVDLEREIEIDVENCERLKNEIIKKIHTLPKTNYIRVLYLKYIKYKEFRTLKAVSEKMNFAYDYVRELHLAALHEMEKKLTTECKK